MLVLAVGVWLGARRAVAVPPAAALAAVVVGLAWRRPVLLVLAAAALASGLAAGALAGLEADLPARIDGPVTLLSDPEATASGQRVEVRAGRLHLEAWARGGAAGALVDRLGGERVWVVGRVRPRPDRADWRVARHLAGVLEIDRVERWDGGDPASRAANRLRRTLADGAAVLPDDTRALFAGFVLGDDRGRSALVTDDFRGSGLSHLLVVSGQNVAFVLALAEPVLRRFGLAGRLVATLVVLASFALVTRFEPSVLRASAMAAVAVAAATWGRDASGLRILGLAVTGVILLDPLLVRSLGFQLSVAASLGIVALAPRLTAILPGPAWLARPVGVSLAAQVGVAPLLLDAFGGLPVVAPLANLAAAPAAGPISTWGLTAGVVAGVVPGSAGVLHVPTRLLVGWVAAVARVAVALPLGHLGPGAFAAVVVLGLAAAASRRAGRRRLAGCAVAALIGVLVMPGIRLHTAAAPVRADVATDAVLWRSEGHALVVVGGRVREEDLLAGLRESGVTRLDVVVCRTDAAALHGLARTLEGRYGSLVVVAPPGSPPAGAEVPVDGSRLVVGGLRFDLTVQPGSLGVEVAPGGGSGEEPV